MALRTVTPAPGAAAIAAVAAAVRATQQGDGLRAVHVVVRAEDSAVLVRRALARRLGGLAAVEVLPLDRLARGVLAAAGVERVGAAPRPVLAAALRRAALAAGGPLGASADQQFTLDALVASYQELTSLGETGLGVARARGGFGGAVADVVHGARRRLVDHGWVDDAALLTRAGARAGSAPTTPVVVLWAEAPTPVERAALHALAEHRDVTVVDTSTGVAPGPAALAVRAVSDPDEEVRDALRAIDAALAAGVPAEHVGLAWTSESYRRTVAEQLGASGLPWHGPGAGTLLETAPGRAALTAVEEPGDGPPPADWRDLASRVAAATVAAAPDDPSTPAVVRLVSQLGALDLLGPLPSAATVASAVRAELAAVLPRHGTVGRGVTVGSLRRVADGAPWSVVVVVGLAEGLAPAGAGGASLLSDTDRDALGLPTTAEQDARQHRRLLAAIGGAGAATLSWPQADLRRTTRRSRSRWVDQLVEEGRVTEQALAPSSWGAVARRTTSATAADHRLRAAMAEPARLADTDGVFAAGLRALTARHVAALTAFDGDLSGEDLAPLRLGDRPVAPTQLEQAATCGRSYFTRVVLGVGDHRVGDELAGPDPGTNGSLVHEVLDRAIKHERTLGRPLTRAEVVTQFDAAMAAMPELLAQLLHMPVLLRENHHRTYLARVWQALDTDVAHRAATGRVPIDEEVRFGRNGDVQVTLPSGRRLAVKGVIDRVDRFPDGRLALVDYKTGPPATGVKADPLGGGARLQLAIYAVAAQQHFDAPIATVEYRYVRDGNRRVDELSAAAHTELLGPVVEAIVDTIERGVFVPGVHHTTQPGRPTCYVCDPHGLLARVHARRTRTLERAGLVVIGRDDD